MRGRSIVWGGQSCLQPPFRRLFRAARESSEPQSPAESRRQPGLAAPRLVQKGRQNQKVCGIRLSACRADLASPRGVGLPSAGEQHDPGSVAFRQFLIARVEGGVHCFSQSDVRGIIGGEVVP